MVKSGAAIASNADVQGHSRKIAVSKTLDAEFNVDSFFRAFLMW
jgi:hypothetical protein